MFSQNIANSSFTNGPRIKGEATQQFEALIKNILESCAEKKEIQISYNLLSEMIITVNQQTYNLTQILKHNPDFEQLLFSNEDIERYDAYLRDPMTVNQHVESLVKQLELKLSHAVNDDEREQLIKDIQYTKAAISKAKILFPHLTLAEISPVFFYTKNFYAPIYHLLKFAAQHPLPSVEDKGKGKINGVWFDDHMIDVICDFAAKLNPAYDPSNPSYDPSDIVLITALVKETLLHTSIAASALSKRMQSELKIIYASTYANLEKNISDVSGVGLALVRDEDAADFVVVSHEKSHIVDDFVIVDHEEMVNDFIFIPDHKNDYLYRLYVVGYGQIIGQYSSPVHLQELLNTKKIKNNSGVTFTPSEIERILAVFNQATDFSLCQDMDKLSKTKLMNVLRELANENNLMHEKIYHAEEDGNYFEKAYIPDISKNMDTQNSYQFIKTFCSTSTVPMEDFCQGTKIITTLINPLGYVKNIDPISRNSGEEERLLIPNQQIAYTKIETTKDEFGKPFIKLEGYPIRSIDGVSPLSYSHEMIMLRENLINLFSAIEGEGKGADHEMVLQWLKSIIVTMEDKCSKAIIVNIAKNLISYYLNIIITHQPDSLTLFRKNISDKNALASLINAFIKDNFDMCLPETADEIKAASETRILVSELFEKKSGCQEEHLDFSLEAVKIFHIENYVSTRLTNTNY